MTPYYSDESVMLYHGDALDVLRTLPAGSVDCCVTSPPYYGLRDYGVPGQYGLEDSPTEYVDRIRAVFTELLRVLAPDGTLWLNLGDSYARGNGQGNSGPASTLQGGTRPSFREDGAAVVPTMRSGGLPGKNLLGLPWRIAFALQDDGWILRSDIIWAKPNGMPESVTDRPSANHEHVFLFSRSARYWFDLDPIREPYLWPEARDGSRTFGGTNGGEGKVGAAARRGGLHTSTWGTADGDETPYPPGMTGQRGKAATGRRRKHYSEAEGRNPGNVWWLPAQPFPEAHFAVMPPRLAERCILAGCKPGGVVLDPFAGSCTTGLVAGQHGRRFVGVDLSAQYLELALRTRLRQGALIEPDGAA